MDTQILQDLGLTGAEIKVFITSLELGPTPAGPIVEKSGLQNAVVHRALHALIEKGLITYILEGKKKIYSAVSPNQLLNYIEEKKDQLKKILPELIAKQKTISSKPKASLFQGLRGIKELIHSMLDTTSKDYRAFGGPKKAHDLLGDHFWANFHLKRIEKHIKAKLIFHSSLTSWAAQLNKRRLTTVKLTAQDFEELTETIICGNKVAIILYLEKPYGFLIEEKIAANSYREFFNLLWKTAK